MIFFIVIKIIRMEIIDLLVSKYGIHIVSTLFKQDLTRDEVDIILIEKRNEILHLEKNIKYNLDTILVMEQENNDIIEQNLESESKYKKIFEKNLIKIPNMYQEINIYKQDITKLQMEINEINSRNFNNIPISTSEFGYRFLQSNRIDE